MDVCDEKLREIEEEQYEGNRQNDVRGSAKIDVRGK
mgnify:FL=1